MASPFPQLQIYPSSGLTFPWAEYHGSGVVGSFEASLGSDGVALGLVMIINWRDLEEAVKQILGYSWRDTTSTTPAGNYWIRRKLPWQHPYWNQMFAKRVSKIQGLQMRGKNITADDLFVVAKGGGVGAVGAGAGFNTGPWTDYAFAVLTIQFWRPPYTIRTDGDILDTNGNPQEWLRYVDRVWSVNTQMLSRKGTTFQWCSASNPSTPKPLNGGYFPGPLGQKITKIKMTRKWHQVPEASLFQILADNTPSGTPHNTIYTQTPIVNPITGYTYPIGSPMTGCVNAPIGGGAVLVSGTTTNGSKIITGLPSDMRITLGGTGAVGLGGSISVISNVTPVGTCLTSVDSATQVTMTQNASVNGANNILFVFDTVPSSRLFGAFAGTLLYEGIEFTPQPLQLPPFLMQILSFGKNEPISQNQYDVTLHCELFDPPLGTGEYNRGHNCMPYSGNGLYYPVRSQQDDLGGTTGHFQTPFQYADFTDIFRSL